MTDVYSLFEQIHEGIQEELLISLLWQSKRQRKKQDLISVDPFGCDSIPCCLSLVIKAACRGVTSSAQEAEPSAFEQALHHSPFYEKCRGTDLFFLLNGLILRGFIAAELSQEN